MTAAAGWGWLAFAVRFSVLGPLEVRDDGPPVRLGGPQQHAVLALLLVTPDQVVSADRLADQLWHGRPPPTARGLVQGCIAGLRRVLPGEVVLTRAPGYLVRVAPGALDAGRFEDLVRAAEQAEAPVPVLREALALWRGPAFDGIGAEACRVEAARLAERRLTVVQRCLDAELRQGRYPQVVAEAQALVRDHPLRESLWLRLMTALHREGRRAEALQAYRELRRHLVDELGIEPSAEVRELHREILAGTATPRRADAVMEKPAQVPAAVSAFTGRAEHLARLDELLPARGTAVICGMAGVGKTALAVEWAHRHRDQFPDGQLYVDLRGFTATGPLPPMTALSGFLQALGVPADQVPAEPGQAAALYRTLAARRELLVVLDNAGSAAQVRPLLPGGARCLTLVTSRRALGGLVAREGAHHLTLDALAPPEAAALLVRVLGAGRTAGRTGAVAELARLCAYLPLALRIAAANLTLRPDLPVADHVAELGAGSRLTGLAVTGDDDSAVRAAFDLSYAALPGPARRLFRLLALPPGTDFTVDDVAALSGADPARAGALTAALVDAHLVVALGGGRHTLHDLLRLYATERSRTDDQEPERRAAVARLYDHYLARAERAAEALYPHMLRLRPAGEGGLDHAAARRWLDAERPNLVRAVVAAADDGPRAAGWLLADALRGYFHLSRHTADWLTVGEAALLGARREGDLRGQAAALHSLGTACRSVGEMDRAARHYEEALRLARRAGWRESEATTLGNLGIVDRRRGRLGDAARHLADALRVDREIGRRAGEANNLGNLATVQHEMGRLPEAAAGFTAAIALNAASGSRHGEALWLTGLGHVDHDLGRPDRAAGHFRAALDRYVQVGDRDGEATARCALATVDCDRGDLGSARLQADAALRLAGETGDQETEAIARNALGRVDRLLGRPDNAVREHLSALDLATRTSALGLAGESLIGLARAECRRARYDDARAYAVRAQALAHRLGMRVVEERAHAALSEIRLRSAREPSATAPGCSGDAYLAQ